METPGEETVEPPDAETEERAIAVVLLRWRSGLDQTEFAARTRMSRQSLRAYEKALRRANDQKLERCLDGADLPQARLGRLLAASREAQQALAPERCRPLSGELEPLVRSFSERLGELARGAFQQAFETVLAAALPGRLWPALAAPSVADRLRAPALWARLESCSSADRRFLVEEHEDFWDWALCEKVTELSQRAAVDDAGQAFELAQLALLIAELLPGEEAWGWRVEGWARGHVANSLRVGNDLKRAELAFAQAKKRWSAGAPADPGLLNAARMLSLEASLRRDQRRLSEALVLLNEGLAIDRWGETSSLLLNKAKTLEEMGDYEAALATLQEAKHRVDSGGELWPIWGVRMNTAVNLYLAGRAAEAAPLLPEIKELAGRLGNALDKVRVRWLEGRVDAGLGREAEALVAFEEVRQAFAHRELPYDQALLDLDLALLHLQHGRLAEAQELAAEMLRIFPAQGIYRETLAALRLFHGAVASGAATGELARALIRYLHRARHDPELRFEA